jgi:hydrogenase maturation protease
VNAAVPGDLGPAADGSAGADPGGPGPDALDGSGTAAERSDTPGPAGGGPTEYAPGLARVSGPAPDAPGPARGPAGGVLVIGYGNALRSDDGVGVHAAGLLARDPRLARVDVRAMVQLAPEVAAEFAEVSLAVLVDATVEAEPGVVVVRRLVDGAAGAPAAPDSAGSGAAGAGAAGAGAGAAGAGATSHHVGVEELVALAAELYGAAPEVVVVSVGVATMEAGEELSPAVAAALPDVANAVAELVMGRG